MAITKIQGSTQIQGVTIKNAQIAPDAAIETNKLAEGAELLKRDGSVSLTGNLDANNNTIENVAAPVNSSDVATKGFVDSEVSAVQSDLATESARVTALENDLDAEESARVAADATLQSNIDAEAAARAAADGALDARLVDAEENLAFPIAHLFEDNSAVYADAKPGVQDPSSLIRDGWYYTNENAGDKINWYFYDGTSTNTVAVDDLTSYALITLDSLSSTPFMVVYTRPTGTGDILPGFAHSSRVYMIPAGSMEVGKQYLVHVGEDPNIHKDLPRVELVAGTTVGDFDGSQIVMTSSLHTNSAASVGAVQMVVEGLGVSSASYKQHFDLRIKVASQLSLDAEETARAAADVTLQSNIDAEAAARAAADTTLQSNIDAEATARAAADAAIQSDLDVAEAGLAQEILDRTAADAAVQANLDTEEAARIAGDASTLASAQTYTDTAVANLVDSAPELLDTLNELAAALGDDPNFATTVAGQVAAVQTNLDAEESARVAADATLQSNIDAEESARIAADTALQGEVDAVEASVAQELLDRAAGDAAVQANLDTEEAARIAADAILQSNIDDEESARISADSDLQAQLDAIGTGNLPGLEADIDALESGLAQEILDRTAADAAIQSDLDVAEAGLAQEILDRVAADATLQSNIDAEAAARAAADTALQGEVDAVEASVAQELLDRAAGDASTLSSAQSYTDQKVADLVDSAPEVLDTLKELSDALGGDENFATTVANQIGQVASDLAAEEAARVAADANLQAQLTAATSGVVVTSEVPVGVLDGVNKSFQLAHTPNGGTARVYLNGLLQNVGADNDYVLANNVITFSDAPESNAVILVSYVYNGNVLPGILLGNEPEISKLSSPIVIGEATIPAGGTHTYTINLGETYKELLLTSFEWVEPSARGDVPAARLGLESFPTAQRRYNFCLKVKQGAGNSVRLFDNLLHEKMGASATPVQSSYGQKVSEVGTALGYGIISLASPLDHIATFGKKVEVSDVYLDGQNLIVKVKNNESQELELAPYLGVSAVTQETTPVFGIMINRVNVFDTDSINILGGSFSSSIIHISHDRGVNFSQLSNDNTSDSYLGMITKGTKNDFFVALISQAFGNIRIVDCADLTAITSINFNTGLIGLNTGQGGFPTTEEYRHHDVNAQSWTWPNNGRSIDAADKNTIVFASFMTGFGRLDKVSNVSTIDTILKIEDEYPELTSRSDPWVYHDYNTYVKVVDANTYFTSFCQYTETFRNCFVKTTDGGTSWQKLLEDHPEFVRAHSRAVSVSEDGLEIAVVTFTAGYDVGGFLPEAARGKALFNYSLNGGTTWAFNTGSWGEITSQMTFEIHGALFSGSTNDSTPLLGELALHQKQDEFLMIVRDNDNRPRIFRSKGGQSWSSGTVLSTFEFPAYQPQQRSPLGFDANEHFIAFGAYGYIGTAATDRKLWVGSEISGFTNYPAWGLKE